MRGAILIAAILLAGCGQPEAERAPAGAVPSATPSAALPAPESLVGEYRVAGIGGAPLDAPFGIALSIGPDRIEFDNCQQIAWRYRYAGGRLETERAPPATTDSALKRPPCAATLPPPISNMVRALDAARQAERTRSNGIELSGDGSSVLLFSQ